MGVAVFHSHFITKHRAGWTRSTAPEVCSPLQLEIGVQADSHVRRKRKMKQAVSLVIGQVEVT